MTKNFKTVVEALNETGFYLAFCNLVVNKIVRIPIKKIISAAGRNIDGITNWLEHAAKDACSAFNQDVPIDDRIMKLEGEILRVTHFCFDPRIREAFKEMGYERISELYESRGIDIEDTGMLEKVKSAFCTYVFLLNQQDKTLGIDLSVVPSVGSYSIRFNECIQDSIVFKDEAAAKAFAKANGLEKPFISFYKMTAYWQPLEEGDAV